MSSTERKYISVNRENQWIILMLLEKLSTVQLHDHFRYTIKNAIKSLVKHHEIVNTKEDAEKLKFIKSTISSIIEEARPNKPFYDNQVQSYIDRDVTPKRKKRLITKRKKPYYPKYKTGNWAILYVMAVNKDNYPNNDYKEYTKNELIETAQPFCDCSYIQATSEQSYTAWSGVHHYLVDYKLITRTASPAKYNLTDKGYEIGKRCIKEKEYNDQDDDIKMNTPKTPNKNRKRKNNPLTDIRNYYVSPPPIKRRRADFNTPKTPKTQILSISRSSSLFGLRDIKIIDQLHLKYDLFEAITLKNGNKYRLHLNIDTRENVFKRKKIRRIDIWKNLKNDISQKIPVKNMLVNSGDYHWFLININDDKDIKLLNIYLERKQWNDLAQSLKDGRYWIQKDIMKFSIEDDVILTNGKIIYLLENHLKTVAKKFKKGCKQARVSTESRDKFNVVCTKNKYDTLRLLVNYTYMIREWISGDNYSNLDGYLPSNVFNEDNLIQLNVFNDILKETYNTRKYKISSRFVFMRSLLNINGVDQRIAWYITKKYPTFRVLWDEWIKYWYDDDLDILLSDNNSNNHDNDKAQLLLHNTVRLQPYWQYISEIMNDQECKIPDDDIMNVINMCKQQNDNALDIEYVSEEISRKIWTALVSE